MSKSDKELAFLFDQFVAPDWGERFAELFDEHVEVPKQGGILYAGAGTGSHALKILERAGAHVSLTLVDESPAQLDLARAKAAALKMSERTIFSTSQLEALDFTDDQFQLVIGNATLVAAERLPELLTEMVRVATPGAEVALSVVTAASFGEFFSIFWEAASVLDVHAAKVEGLINELPTISVVEALAAREGLDNVESWTQIEEFYFASGQDFLAAPIVANFLLANWLEILPGAAERSRVLEEVARIIDEERNEGNFTLSIKATVVRGQKTDA